MGSAATPPWMTELLARNHKIVRNMWSSTDSYFEGDKLSHVPSPNQNQVVDPLSPSKSHNTSGGTTGGTTGIGISTKGRMGAVAQDQMQRTRRTSTEKSSPIREDNAFLEEDSKPKQKFLRNGEEESILEYGPGIVRKLRSRYQSLALRQYSTRPSLRRSASLENVLDAVDASGDGIKRESPSPAQFDENYSNSRSNKAADNKPDSVTLITKSKSASAVVERQENEKKAQGPRGRASQTERRDRMRRARSVDALHRTKHEEEILEKFKAVVLPKEEIVIIEVTKPRANLNGLELSNKSPAYYLATSGDKAYPTELFISPNRTTAGLGLTLPENQQGGLRTRSFVSPEHELPPHDIVRETARIFEKNQENLSNGNKKVGQALRLSKSASLSSSSSLYAQSTPPPSPTQQEQKGTVMAQGLQSMQVVDKRDKSPSTGPSFSNITNAKPNANHGLKQVGIIRPTVSHPISPTSLNLTNGEKVGRNNDTRPTALSPILSPSQQPYKSFLHTSQKPPLSPKPIFTSSPKPTALSNQNFARSASVESPLANQVTLQSSNKPAIRNVDSISPVPLSTNSNRVKSPTPPPVPDRQFSSKPVNGVALHSAKSKAETNNESSIENSPTPPKGRESPSGQKRNQYSGPLKPLKHIPNSFTIDTPNITPAATPTIPKTSPLVNGVKAPKISPTDTKTVPVVKNKELPKVPQSVTQDVEKLPQVSAPSTKRVEDPSQLRAHQKQKSNQGSNSTMVFNFTTRSSVPDYIEDDGLHTGKFTLAGTVTDESADNIDSPSDLSKPVKFVGANVIINGKSSIQKKPKSTKLSISFNEDATTTYEYPSESSLLLEESDVNEKDKDMLGHKGPSVINNSGTGLGNYTSKLASNDYQLGNFVEASPNKKADLKNGKHENELIEDYLKPDSETTTWSNEITADILF